MSNIKKIVDKSHIYEKELVVKLFHEPKNSVTARKLLEDRDFDFMLLPFKVIIDCHINNKSLQAEFVANGLKLSEFVSIPSSPRPIEMICHDLKELAKLKRVGRILDSSLKEIPIEEGGNFVSNIHQQLVDGLRKADEDQDIRELIEDFKSSQKEYKEKFLLRKGIIGLPTGYQKLDEAIDGLRKDHLWIIGGYTSMGKTWAALNIVANMIREKKKVVFYTLEMSSMDILSRLVGLLTKQNGTTILKAFPHDEQAVANAFEMIRESGLVIKSGGMDITDISFSAYEQTLSKPVDLFVVDFLQLVTVKGAKSDYESTTISILEIQNLAKKLHAPFIVLSQVSNESAKFGDSMVMGFKGSGAIAAAADLAIEINMNEGSKDEYRSKMSKGEEVKLRWNIKKNRHGRSGYIDMLFDGKVGIFREDVINNF